MSHDERVREALGLTATQRLIGFLYMGTPAEAPPAAAAPRVAPAGFARDWPPSG